MNDRIGIEFLSVFDLPPVQFVELVAELGCHHMSVGLTPMGCGIHDYPPFSLRDDKSLRRDMIKAMDDHNVSISLGEGFGIKPGTEVSDFAGDLELMHELGARRINSYCMEPDIDRGFDQLAKLAEMAKPMGIETTIEFVPGLSIGNLETALAALDHIGSPTSRLLVDTMHWVRTGSTVDDLAAVDPDRIGYVQICDVPLVATMANYGEEAMFERMVPGEGELPLFELFSALPKNIPVGIEVPRRSVAQSGASPFEYMEPCVKATDRLLSQS